MTEPPKDHPRAASLRTRERLVAGLEDGLTSRAGLIAQGRGEAFDYLLGERTLPSADRAARAGAAQFLLADQPVVSVNGNVAALAPAAVVAFAEATDAAIEVNLFHRTAERVERIATHLRAHGAETVLGPGADARLPGLDHDRALVDADGIAVADTVLVPLEDGDRAAALADRGTTEVVIDLNPLSRSARSAAIPVIDNLVRALPNMTDHAETLQETDRETLRETVTAFDPDGARRAAERALRERGGQRQKQAKRQDQE